MVLGIVGVLSAAIVRVLFDYSGDESRRWLSLLRYTRTTIFSMVIFLGGVALNIPLAAKYLSNSLSLPDPYGVSTHMAVTGLSLMINSAILFIFTLIIHASSLASRFKPSEH
jgi:TRAP-type C4-dicarboxylate transport system permease small subunit